MTRRMTGVNSARATDVDPMTRPILFVWPEEAEVSLRTVVVHQQIRQDVLAENHLEVANASSPETRERSKLSR